MIAKIIVLPFILIAMGLIAYDLYYDQSHVYAIIFFSAMSVLAFTMRFWVEEKWYGRRLAELGNYESAWIEDFLPYYNKKNQDDKTSFKAVLARELILKEFIPMGNEKLVEELKIMAIAPAIHLGLHHYPEVLKHYNRIVFYPHPFITPVIDQVHICETHHDDGVIILCSEMLQAAHVSPKKFYNIALHEWCDIALKNNCIDKKNLPTADHELERIIQMNIQQLEEYLGVKANQDVVSAYINFYKS